MMSLVGCSEPEMANVMRALGYRVHPPSEENGPLHSFSIKPRFVREREEQRERQRLDQLKQREEREKRRRERPEKPNERQFFAGAQKPGQSQDRGPPGNRPHSAAPTGGKPSGDRPQGNRPPNQGQGPRGDRRDGPRPPRRDSGGPALRLYATTEKAGDAAANSPFAKLLELKLGGKK